MDLISRSCNYSIITIYIKNIKKICSSKDFTNNNTQIDSFLYRFYLICVRQKGHILLEVLSFNIHLKFDLGSIGD